MGKAGMVVLGVVSLVLLLLASGCGGGSSSGAESTIASHRPFPRLHGPSREFVIPGGDNIVQFFGQEASPPERERVSRRIHAWMKARVAEAWARDCKYLSRVYARSLIHDAERVTGKPKNCPQTLAFFGDEASGTSGNTLTGPIDSLRVRGVLAYAQWHGPEADWILSMRKERGEWWVASAGPSERTK